MLITVSCNYATISNNNDFNFIYKMKQTPFLIEGLNDWVSSIVYGDCGLIEYEPLEVT